MSGKDVKPGSSKDPEGKDSKKLDHETSTPQPDTKVSQYPPDDKPKKILDMMDRCRASGEFCDVQLKLSEYLTVYAHKAILGACSPYFEGMFTSTFVEATSDIVDMSNTTENPEVLESVINSFYGHKFEINEDNAGEVLNLATMLLIDDLREVCGRVMRKTLGVRNAAEMLQLAFSFQIEDLKELVSPILYSRFHDYIMFQEDLVEMGTECFDYLLKLVNTGYVSRKAEFIKLILNWFSRSESDDRAKVAINALQFRMNFEVTNYIYKEVEKDIGEVIAHLKEVNSDVSPEMRKKFILLLEALEPVHYNQDETYDSDLEEIPALKIDTGRLVIPFIGPRTKQEGYTKEEENKWKQHREDVVEFNIWDAKWHALLKKREKENPNYSIFDENEEMIETRSKLSEIRRRHDKTRDEFIKRNMKVKTPEELEEESRLLDMVVVLAPCNGIIESGGKTSEDGFNDDEMIVCAYVTRKKAWYRLGSLSASGLKNSSQSAPKDGPGSASSRPRYDDHDHPDPEEFEEMMYMYGPDMPEMMMMMEDMPGPSRRRMMEQMSRRRMPPRMMHRMMMDMDDDMPGHPMMMMMRDRGRWGFRGRGKMSKSGASSLLKGKWKMAYLKQKLYFCHKDIVQSIWSYDLVEQTWNDYSINSKGKNRESGYIDAEEAIDFIVMGQTLYVVVLISMLDTRNEYWSNRYQSESDTRSVKTRFKILKLNENDRIEAVYETKSHDVYVNKSQFEKQEEDKDSRYSYDSVIPMKPGVLKMVMHREDDEKLDIFVMVRTDYRGILTFNLGYMFIVYLDLKEEDCEIDLLHHHNFVREMTPLMNDDILGIANDDLKVGSQINLAKPGSHNRCIELGGVSPDSTHFRDGEELYPLCPSLTANNGRNMWILEGGERDISEMTVASPKSVQEYHHRPLTQTMTAPPPVSCFSMACPGRIDRNVLRRYNPPTKYLHA